MTELPQLAWQAATGFESAAELYRNIPFRTGELSSLQSQLLQHLKVGASVLKQYQTIMTDAMALRQQLVRALDYAAEEVRKARTEHLEPGLRSCDEMSDLTAGLSSLAEMGGEIGNEARRCLSAVKDAQDAAEHVVATAKSSTGITRVHHVIQLLQNVVFYDERAIEHYLNLIVEAQDTKKLGMSLQPLEGLATMMAALATDAQQKAQAVASL